MNKMEAYERKYTEDYAKRFNRAKNYVCHKIGEGTEIKRNYPYSIVKKIQRANLNSDDKASLIADVYQRYFKYAFDRHVTLRSDSEFITKLQLKSLDIQQGGYNYSLPDEAEYNRIHSKNYEKMAEKAFRSYITTFNNLRLKKDYDVWMVEDRKPETLIGFAVYYFVDKENMEKKGQRFDKAELIKKTAELIGDLDNMDMSYSNLASKDIRKVNSTIEKSESDLDEQDDSAMEE